MSSLGSGAKQKLVLGATANGAISRAVMESRTGLSGNDLDQLLYRMLKAKLIRREGVAKNAMFSSMRAPKPPAFLNPAPPNPTPVAPTPAPLFDLAALDAAINGVAQGLAERIAEKIVASITSAPPAAVSRAAEKFDVSQFAPKPAAAQHKKVFIVGLRQKDTGFITAEFATKFDLIFAETDEYSEKTKANARNADAVILMTDHLNHSMVKFIEAAGAKPILVSGGQTTLRAKLDALPA
jgi:hypothetical protein